LAETAPSPGVCSHFVGFIPEGKLARLAVMRHASVSVPPIEIIVLEVLGGLFVCSQKEHLVLARARAGTLDS
ncbi:MAG TPA: hypothetical protein VFV92_08310, partial [Candidatus Bathyarchaeia archaeon]|nr:hypothetical protein [Candidatus Bathyarchaeia archaeon]